MQVSLFTTSLLRLARMAIKVGNGVTTILTSRPNLSGFCGSIALTMLTAKQAKTSDKQSKLNHEERHSELKKAIAESERKVTAAFKKQSAQPIKELSSSSWFWWTDKRLENFQKAAELKENKYLDAIEGLASLLLDDGPTDDDGKKARIEEVLQSAGVEQFSPEIGEEFDEAKHVVIHQISDLKNPPNIILQIIADGYRCNGRVIKRAQVGVSRTVETRKRKTPKI